MQDNIFKNLREYYQPTVLFQAHVDLILEPIHELHKLYYDNVLESKQFIYQKGYELAELEVLNKIQEHVSMKSDTSPIFHPEDLSSLLEKDQLFGTSKSAAAKLEKDTFNASQKTLTRVDKDINNILVDSYQEGVGYKEVGRRLTKKFNQLKTFEAERIARTETHSAHELGTMQAFEDLDVEYLQWDAHLDNRVRETHEEINGEIIPLGGTFSNGLKYPGDKNGPIKEWINCRCHGVPYILPPGTIAPNMPYFRESDLIIVEKYTPLNFENKLDNSHTLNVSESELQEFIINGEKISYDDIKPFMIKNWEKTAEYDKKYEKLLDSANKKDLKHGTHLEDEYKFTEEIISSYHYDYDYESFNEWGDIKKELIQDILENKGTKNSWKIIEQHVQKPFDINRLSLSKQREFAFYQMKKETGTLSKSQSKIFSELKKLAKNKRYHIEMNKLDLGDPSQNLIVGKEWYAKVKCKDWHFVVEFGENVLDDVSYNQIQTIIQEELPLKIGQSINKLVISNKQPKVLMNGGYVRVGGWQDSTNGKIVTFLEHPNNSDYDWAIDRLKTTLVHEGMHNIDYVNTTIFDLEADKYVQISRFGAISNSKAYVDAVRTDNFLRRTGAIKITERPETGAIRTVNPQSRDKIWVSEYAEGYAKGRYGEDYLTHPASEDLAESGATYFANKEWFRQNFPTRYEVIDKVLNSEGREVIDELATQQSDYKFLKSNALTKTKNRVTKYFSKSSTPKEHDKFKLTSSQERNYKKLSIRKESLGFLDKRKLEKLENQVKFNTLHNKKLASNLSYEENKQYKQLYNQFRKEFNLPELKSSERNIFNDLLNRESKRTQNKFEKHLEKLKNTKEFKTDGKTFINFAKDSDDKIIIQVNLQNLNKKQKEILNKWSADIDIYLKEWCHKSTNPNYLEKYVSKKITYEECDKLGKELTNLIESLSTEQTLQENTILWRGIGMKDERMDLSNFVVGEKRKFGEFTSTSFDLDTAESFAMYTDDDEFAGYILKIHAPKGTKGGAIDGERIGNAGTEYEYLLSKNQEYITLNVDENLRIIDILLVN